MLEALGHTCDAQPRAMGMELAAIDPPELAGIDWTPSGELEAMCAINDSAYGWASGTWRAGLGGTPVGSFVYVARVDGEPAATVLSADHAGLDGSSDCSVWCVGTLEAARGR